MPKTKKLGSTTKKVPKVQIEMSVNDEVQKVSGDDILSALKKFVCPDPIKTDVVIRVKGGKERILGVFEARRAFNNGVALGLTAEYLRRNIG